MLNVTGTGYSKKVMSGYEDGNWFIGFFIKDESGEEFLCKSCLIQHKNLQSGSYVGIFEGVLRKFRKEGIDPAVYVDITKMQKIEDDFYNAQKQAIERAHKLK
jgi:hypothetical protein